MESDRVTQDSVEDELVIRGVDPSVLEAIRGLYSNGQQMVEFLMGLAAMYQVSYYDTRIEDVIDNLFELVGQTIDQNKSMRTAISLCGGACRLSCRHTENRELQA